ncbi:unnamed protein product [Parascedosporium putredinis]|uniref:Uncharacterized protein n=1 Tax=Parascedosporium putredinis TaxID=1442378 RepID=A0A9P1M792_9PEZI|nr:unnamed protein product [Parascedosporium putredinis]CAI7988122.1 unnamed protein product [Parascedosporium putredinis]
MILPKEKIKEYWKVYTTTFRRLIDPTANRLEHFWWHVWGSDRRYLPGAVLAKLFEEISTGPTIAPIPGPPNRWEPPVFGDQPPPWELKRQAEKSGVAEDTNATKNTDPQGGSRPNLPEATKAATDENTISTVGSISRWRGIFGKRLNGKHGAKKVIVTGKVGQEEDIGTREAISRLARLQETASAATPDKFAIVGDVGARDTRGWGLKAPGWSAAFSTGRGVVWRFRGGQTAGTEEIYEQQGPGGLEAAQPTSPLHETTRKSALRDRIVEEPSGGPGDTAGLSKLDRTKSTEFSPIGAKTRPRIPRSQSHIEPQRFGMGMGRSLRPTLAAEPTASTTNVAALGTIIDFDKSEMPRLTDNSTSAWLFGILLAHHDMTKAFASLFVLAKTLPYLPI